MADRDPVREDFVGKTITEFDGSCINIWRFGFSDGTAIAIEVESFGDGLHGMVVCEECAMCRIVAPEPAVDAVEAVAREYAAYMNEAEPYPSDDSHPCDSDRALARRLLSALPRPADEKMRRSGVEPGRFRKAVTLASALVLLAFAGAIALGSWQLHTMRHVSELERLGAHVEQGN